MIVNGKVWKWDVQSSMVWAMYKVGRSKKLVTHEKPDRSILDTGKATKRIMINIKEHKLI